METCTCSIRVLFVVWNVLRGLRLVAWLHSFLCLTFVSGLQGVSSRFVFDARVGAGVLGLYGSSGVGKTTLCKALCDYFSGEFFGRVCYVDVGELSRMGVVCHVERNETLRLQRAKLILERMCGFDEVALRRIKDSGQVIFVLSILAS
jgi:hypothetical protein